MNKKIEDFTTQELQSAGFLVEQEIKRLQHDFSGIITELNKRIASPEQPPEPPEQPTPHKARKGTT